MHQLNSESFHVDLSKSAGVLARIDVVNACDYVEDEIEGDFSCTLRIRGTVQMKPTGMALSDSVGIVLGVLLEEIDDSEDAGFTFTPGNESEEEEG